MEDGQKGAMSITIMNDSRVSHLWVAVRFSIGHDLVVIRSLKQGKFNEAIQKKCEELREM